MGTGRRAFYMLFAAVMVSVFGLFPFLPGAKAEAREVIRVGYPIQQGLCEIDANGNYSGYTYEYLQEIAQYTGWEYEFVQLPGTINESYPTFMSMLQQGDIDLMGALVYSEELARTVDFASQSYGTAYTTLEVLKTNTAITKDNYQTMQNIRVGISAGAKVRAAELEQFCKSNHIEYTLVRMNSQEEIDQALRSGRVDAAVSTDLTNDYETRTIAKFSPRPFYFVTTQGRTDILQQLNRAILNISEVDPAFSANLMERYFGDSEQGSVLTNGDKEYIMHAGTLRVAVMLGQAPFQYRDPGTGELRGIAIDLMDYIQGTTGLQFEFVPVETQEELSRLTQNREIDIVASVTYDYEQAAARGVSLTRPYASSQSMVLASADAMESGLSGKRMAASRMLYDEHSITGHTGEIIWYDTLKQCVQAVREGETDYTCGDGYSIQYFMSQPENRNLHMMPEYQGIHRMSLGVVRPGSAALLSVLNKTIINVPEETLQAMVYENIAYQGDLTIQEYIAANPVQSLFAVGIVALLLILALLAVLVTRIRSSRQTALDLKKHYQLYALSNDHYFEYDFRKDRLMLSVREDRKEEQDASIFVYDNAERQDGDDIRRMEFVRYIKGCGDGTEEIRCALFDREPRWMRVTTRTVMDAGAPVYVIGRITDVDEEHRAKEELIEQAQKDGLTQVYNAAEIRARIVERLDGMAKEEQDAMVIVDIDHFKGINDAFGHFVGDQILQGVADVMRAACGPDDFVGRLGGDEFVLYLKRLSGEAELTARCRTLRDDVYKIVLPHAKQTVTISLGGAFAGAGEDYDTLYQRVDGALYEAKNQGRDRFELKT